MVTTSYLKNLDRDNVIRVLNYYGAKNINGDNNIRCCCFIHNGSNPTSFSYTIDKGLWCCNACKLGGDIFELIAVMENKDRNKDFKVVTNKLCEILGIKDDIDYKFIVNSQKELEQMFDFINKKEYIEQEFDLNTLGELVQVKRYRQFNSDFLEQKGVSYSKDLNRLVIPIIKENKTIGATCRRINNNERIKWLHKPAGIKTGSVLYNYTNLDTTKPAVIVEGVFDSWNLELLGMKNAICTFGCSVKKNQIKLLAKKFFSVNIAYDGDTRGRYGALSAYRDLKKMFSVSFYDFKDGQDGGSIKSLDEMELITPEEYIKRHKKQLEMEGFKIEKIFK